MVSSNNAINNTVGASITGVTNTLTVTNASDTASSAARAAITVGGGSAADPSLNFNVSGVTDFEMGIDNNDSDKLKISQGTALGTNDTWIMTTSGERTMPLQPAFEAYISSTVSNVTGDSTVYTIIFDTEVQDVGGNYNNATGVFTAPLTAFYVFTTAILFNNLSAAFTDGFLNLQNSSGFGGRCWRMDIGATSGTNAYWNASKILYLDAGDTVKTSIQVSGGTKTVGVFGEQDAIFSGYMLG